MADVLLQTPEEVTGNTPLVNPIIKPYYRDGFGSKSIGEPQWRPHPINALSVPDRMDNTVKGGNGLDWFSSIRCASMEETIQSSPKQSEKSSTHPITRNDMSVTTQQADQAPIIEERPECVQPAVVYDTYDDFERIYMRRPLEISLRMSVGAKKQVYNNRNGIPVASLGDKSYQVPEYSLDFHKQGSTRPVINFGGSLKCVPDTFVPLQDLPLRPRITFEEKQRRKSKKDEIESVRNLDNWRPADPLSPALQLPGTHG